MNLPHKALVLVADGRKMLLLRNEGSPAQPSLSVEHHEEQDNPPDREQKSDAAGSAGNASTGASGVAGGGSYQETDFHRQEEDRFAAQAAALVNRMALEGAFEALVVAAPAPVLGTLRKHYHKEVKARLTGEIAKDLTGHTLPRIEQALALA